MEKPRCTLNDLHKLPGNVELKLRTMIMLSLNFGFGPKDIQDLTWDAILWERVSFPTSKTDVWQIYLLWLETKELGAVHRSYSVLSQQQLLMRCDAQ